MKILSTHASPFVEAPSAAQTSSLPAADVQRLESLEDLARSLLHRLESLERKIEENQPRPSEGSPPPAQSPERPSSYALPPRVTLDPQAFKKGMFSKMWKYLNDGRSPRAI